MMTKPKITIHDVETNEVIEREMNDAEFAQYQLDIAAAQIEIEAETTRAVEKAALLEKLGITAEEAALLLG